MTVYKTKERVRLYRWAVYEGQGNRRYAYAWGTRANFVPLDAVAVSWILEAKIDDPPDDYKNLLKVQTPNYFEILTDGSGSTTLKVRSEDAKLLLELPLEEYGNREGVVNYQFPFSGKRWPGADLYGAIECLKLVGVKAHAADSSKPNVFKATIRKENQKGVTIKYIWWTQYSHDWWRSYTYLMRMSEHLRRECPELGHLDFESMDLLLKETRLYTRGDTVVKIQFHED